MEVKIVILLMILLSQTGCSHSVIMKECHQVQDLEDMYVCKNLKPWE